MLMLDLERRLAFSQVRSSVSFSSCCHGRHSREGTGWPAFSVCQRSPQVSMGGEESLEARGTGLLYSGLPACTLLPRA